MNRRLAGVPFSRTSPLQPRNSRLELKHSATQPSGSHDILVCPSLACNSSTDQTNTTELDNNVPHIKEPNKRTHTCTCSCEPQPNFNTAHDLRVTHCPERATAQSLSIPFCRHRNIDARRRTNVDTKTFVQTIADQDATLRSSGWSASAKAQQICHWLTRERLQTEELKCLHARAFDPPPTTNFCTLALWTTATRESPRHGDLSHKKQLLPHCRRSMTTAFCSSLAFRTQEPSTH